MIIGIISLKLIKGLCIRALSIAIKESLFFSCTRSSSPERFPHPVFQVLAICVYTVFVEIPNILIPLVYLVDFTVYSVKKMAPSDLRVPNK